MSASIHSTSHRPPNGSPASALVAGDRIGDRLNQRLVEERLRVALAAAGQAGPASVGLIEIESDPTTAGIALLAEQVAGRIAAQLPPAARLVATSATRFVIAISGEPLLEALMCVDRIRDALEREHWCVGREAVTLAFGAGVAMRRGRDEPVAETLAAAERSLAHSRRLAVRRHAAHRDDASDEARSLAMPALDLSSVADRPAPRHGAPR